jgi:hypothetical protein
VAPHPILNKNRDRVRYVDIYLISPHVLLIYWQVLYNYYIYLLCTLVILMGSEEYTSLSKNVMGYPFVRYVGICSLNTGKRLYYYIYLFIV